MISPQVTPLGTVLLHYPAIYFFFVFQRFYYDIYIYIECLSLAIQPINLDNNLPHQLLHQSTTITLFSPSKITKSGENRCRRGGDTQQSCCLEGFAAATGWDPVSGFGSIRYRKFKELFLDMTVTPPVSDGKKDGKKGENLLIYLLILPLTFLHTYFMMNLKSEEHD